MVRIVGKPVGRGLLVCLGSAAVCLALLLLPCLPAGAEGMPPLPHAFYGSVSVDGEPAPVGTVVTARVEGQVCGSITTSYPGKYGSDESGSFGSGVQKLVVQGDLAEGAPIEFYIGTAKAGQTYQFAPGEVTRLDLTVGGPSPQETPEPSPSPALPPPAAPPPPAATVTPTPAPAPAPTPGRRADGIPSPAAFEIADLAVLPPQVEPGQSVDVSVAVTNVGGLEGSRGVTLAVDGAPAASATVTIAPGGVKRVVFTVAAQVPGTHVVEVDGLTASFEVKTPAPASFSLDSLNISPATVRSGETVTCCFTVTNTGDAPGSYIAMLRVDGEAVSAETVSLAGGESRTVSFAVVREESGSHPIEIGDLRGSFTVKEQAAKMSWPLIGGIVGAVVIAGVSTVFLVMRRRRAAL